MYKNYPYSKYLTLLAVSSCSCISLNSKIPNGETMFAFIHLHLCLDGSIFYFKIWLYTVHIVFSFAAYKIWNLILLKENFWYLNAFLNENILSMPGLRKLMTKELQETTKISPSLQQFHFKITNELFKRNKWFFLIQNALKLKKTFIIYLWNYLRYTVFLY